MTAIAAVIALSSTPLFAQNVEPLDTPSVPIDVTPAPVAADPLAAEPVAADPLAPAATAKPAVRKATTAKTTAAKTTSAKTTAARARPAPVRVASAAPAAAPAAVTAAPVVNGPPVEPLPMTPEVAPIEAPIAEPAVTAESVMAMDNALPIAGAGGLALLALAGAGLVVRRRRRRAQQAEDVAWQEHVQALPDAEPAPAMTVEPEPGYMPEQTEPAFVQAFAPAATPVAAPQPAEPEPAAELDGPVTELHDEFDLSRFGPHVQAAYKGPTTDNPSLSMKTRLRRAAAMDQMARNTTDEPARPTKADFMFGSASGKANLKPSQKSSPRPAHTN